jgi:hypothetical protein
MWFAEKYKLVIVKCLLKLFYLFYDYIYLSSIQSLGRFSRNQSPVRRQVGCHFFPPPLDVPTFSARCLHVQRHERSLVAEGGTLRGREIFRQISSRIRIPRNSRDLLRATNLRHGTDGFSSPPKKGMLRFFSPLKIRRLRPGLNPRTWVPRASTHPLVHRIRFF